MSRLIFRIHQLTVMVAASYVTLALADLPDARKLALPYAITTLVLAVASVLTDGHHD